MAGEERLIVYCPNLVPPEDWMCRALFVADAVGTVAPKHILETDAAVASEARYDILGAVKSGVLRPVSLDLLDEEDEQELVRESLELVDRHFGKPGFDLARSSPDRALAGADSG